MSQAFLRPLIQRARDALLSTPDTICNERLFAITEAYRHYEHEPIPVKRAQAFAYYLRHMSLDLETNPVFAGNTSSHPRAWLLLPEYAIGMDAQVAIENPEVAHILDRAIQKDTEDFWAQRSYVKASCSPGHLAVDMARVVHQGLDTILAEVEQCLPEGTLKQQQYRQGMCIALQAVIDWAKRYAAAAEKAAQETDDPLLRECYERMGHACRQVPARPARDLFEGLQAMVLIHLAVCIEGHGMSVSIGLPDSILAPFIGPDFDIEAATDWIGAFMLKITANSFLGRGYLSQTITVGGADANGQDRSNPLTSCFLRACDLLRVGDPPIFLRWHKNLDPQVKALALEMLGRGISMPLLVNDVPTAQGLINGGIPPEDAWQYCVIGCNELAIPGTLAESAWWTSGTLLYVDLINEALAAGASSMDALLDDFEARLYVQARRWRQDWQDERCVMAAMVPTPFTSALMCGCARRGQDLLVGMAYHPPSLFERGFTNAVNALAALEVAFERGVTRPDINNESIRLRLRAAPKWGNDDVRADCWAAALLEHRERALRRVDEEFHQPHHTVCHVVRSLHHVNGAQLPATPDGRRAGAPLADSIGAEVGTAQRGPTATLNSVLNLDAPRFYRGGYNLNLTLPSTTPEAIGALVEGFFGRGGQELQINVFDGSTLRDAQAHPERYGDLLVRIAGLSARFVDLSRLEQEELIRRADCANRAG